MIDENVSKISEVSIVLSGAAGQGTYKQSNTY